MPSKPQGMNMGAMILVLIILLIVEAGIDVFGLPFDEFLVPGEIAGDILVLVLMALFSGLSGTQTRQLK